MDAWLPFLEGAGQADFEELVAQNRILSARNQRAESGGISFDVTTSKVTDERGKAQVKVDLKIDASNIQFEMAGDRHTGRLRITTFYMDSKEKVLGSDWKIMNLRLLDETYKRVLQSGVSYSTVIPLKTPTQIIKVVVYDPWSDKLGSRLVTISGTGH